MHMGRHIVRSSSYTWVDTLHAPPHAQGLDTLHTSPHAQGWTPNKRLLMHRGEHVQAPPRAQGWTRCPLLLMHRDGHVAHYSSCTWVDTLHAPPNAQGWVCCTLLLMYRAGHFARSSSCKLMDTLIARSSSCTGRIHCTPVPWCFNEALYYSILICLDAY